MSPTATPVKDVTEAEFSAEVIESSRTRPVVVDFWAPWCGPCRQLSPMLEAAATRWAGEVDVVKVNVDDAPNLARAFRVQGIPAVKAFRGGAMVAEFTGVQPAAAIDQLFTALAPSPADRAAAAGDAAQGEERETLYRTALAAQADHPRAVVGLARILADRGEPDEASALLARVPADPEARRLVAELALRAGPGSDEIDALQARVEAGEAEARVPLGRALAAAGRHDEGLALLVEAARDPGLRDDARGAAVEIFSALGDVEVVRTWRPRLAAALF